MTGNEFADLMRHVAVLWPDAPEWPDETILELRGELAAFTKLSADRAVDALFRADKSKGWRPSPSTLVATVRDFGEPDMSQPAALPAGCDHLDAHEQMILVVPDPGRVWVPAAVPEAQRDRFREEVSGPGLLGGMVSCRRCGQTRACLCAECGETRAEFTRLLETRP